MSRCSTLLLVTLLVALTGCTTTPQPSPQASTQPTPDEVTPSSPPTSEPPALRPPRVGYVDGRRLRLPDGSSVALPGPWRVSSVTPYAGGYLVTDDRIFEGTVGMHRLDADGSLLESWTSTGPALPSRDGRVAWVSLVAPESGQEGPTLLHVDAVAGGAERTQEVARELMPFLTRWSEGRLVYRVWGRATSFSTDLRTTAEALPLAQELGVPGPDGRLWALVTDRGLEVRQYDGQLVGRVRDRGLARTQEGAVVWEDDDHVLATLVRGRRMCLARVSVWDETVTCATGQRRATYAGMPPLAQAPPAP